MSTEALSLSPSSSAQRGWWLAIALAAAAAVVPVLLWATAPPIWLAHFVDEGGPVERFTEVGYLMVAALMGAVLRPAAGRSVTAALVLLMVAFSAREMDWHKAWTDGASILKFGFYLGPASLVAKSIAGAVVGAVAVSACILAWHAVPSLPQAVRRRTPWAVTVAVFLVMLGVSKCLDRSMNILAEDFHIGLTTSTHLLLWSLEELMEAALPALAGLGLLQHRAAAG